MKNLYKIISKAKTLAIAHKAVASIIIVVVAGGTYGIVKHFSASSTTTKYVLTTVSKGSLVSTISGSGQVAAENQVNITSDVSGDITSVKVAAGDEVVSGQVIATIDASDAQRTVNNAELSLENAKVAYEKAAKEAGNQAASSTSSDLAKAYQAGYNAIVATSIDLPAMFATLDDMYYSATRSPYFSDINVALQADTAAATYKLQSGALFDAAKREYDANFTRYKNISANSAPSEISALLDETNIILQKTLNALSSTYSTIDYISTKLARIPSELASDKSTLSSYVNKVNSDTTSVTNALTSIDDSKTSGTTADLAMKSAQLSVKQAEAALSDAQKALADHWVRAPFTGLIAKVPVKTGDTASNGTNIATIVTKEQIVNISLNEIDAAKISKDEKVSLTFDAIDDLTLPGHVTNVDLVGTVSQGVVTYTAEIAFDATDVRVKPGMTVNADIVTSSKENALLVPSTAIKTLGGKSFVQVFDTKYSKAEGARGIESSTAPRNVAVTVGSSNDTAVEIVSGLNDGDQIVSRVMTVSASKSTTPSIISSLGGSRTGAAAGAAGATRTLRAN